MWYVLAAANALSGDADLVAGTQLKVPEMAASKNDATSFRPYNPGEIVGSTSPGLPYIPPAASNGCAVIAVIIVAIVVIALTYGQAAPYLSNLLTPLSVISTTTGITTAGAIAGGFVAGVAGSIASQVVGKAVGVVDHFSLRTAIGSGFATAITMGVGAATAGLGTVGDMIQAGQWGRAAAVAVVNSSSSYVGNKLAGVKDNSFSWKAIAAGAVSTMLTAKISNKLGFNSQQTSGGSGSFTQDLATNLVGGVVSLHTRRAFGFDDKVDYGSILANAFGTATGNGLVRTINGGDFLGLVPKLQAEAANDAGAKNPFVHSPIPKTGETTVFDLVNDIGLPGLTTLSESSVLVAPAYGQTTNAASAISSNSAYGNAQGALSNGKSWNGYRIPSLDELENSLAVANEFYGNTVAYVSYQNSKGASYAPPPHAEDYTGLRQYNIELVESIKAGLNAPRGEQGVAFAVTATVGGIVGVGEMVKDAVVATYHAVADPAALVVYTASGGKYGTNYVDNMFRNGEAANNFLSQPGTNIKNGVSNWYNRATTSLNNGDGFAYGRQIGYSSAAIVTTVAGGVSAAKLGAGKYSAWKTGRVGGSVPNKPLPGSLSEIETRKWYHAQEDLIASQIDKSLPVREQALQAFQLRNEIRTEARKLMSNRALAAEFDITDPNLTLKQIVERKYQVKGLVGEDLWADILKSSAESRASVDKSLGLTRKK